MSVLNLSLNTNYMSLTSIEHYQTSQEIKQLCFNFESDYLNIHEVFVSIELYDSNDVLKKTYSNSLNIVGEKQANANFNAKDDIEYALIDIYYDKAILEKDIKINFYNQNNCLLDKDNRECNFIYLSRYSNRVTKDHFTNFRMNKNVFDKYLNTNVLSLSEVSFYSDYNFENSFVYFRVMDQVDGYDLFYDNYYNMELKIIDGTLHYFQLLEDNYVNLEEFYYGEEYLSKNIKTNKIIFPYNDEFKEYKCEILIESGISIKIQFNILTNGKLLGECNNSKFCIVRSKE